MPSSPLSLQSLIRFFRVPGSGAATPGSKQTAPFSPGELITAKVLNTRPGAGSVTLAVRGLTVETATSLPLRTGDMVSLFVQSIHPRTIFRLAGHVAQHSSPSESSAGRFTFHARAIAEMFAGAGSALRGEGMAFLGRIMGGREAENLASLLRSLIFVGGRPGKSAASRDYFLRFGYVADRGQTGTSVRGGTGSSLGSMLSAAEQKIAASGEQPPSTLARFITSSLEAVETVRAVNILLGGLERSLFMQIPLAAAGVITTADVIIHLDDDGGKPEQENDAGGTVRLFVEMDSLGPLSVEARLVSGGINCAVTCEKKETALVIESSLEELQKGLEKAGLRVGSLSCRTGTALRVAETIQRIIETAADEEALDVRI